MKENTCIIKQNFTSKGVFRFHLLVCLAYRFHLCSRLLCSSTDGCISSSVLQRAWQMGFLSVAFHIFLGQWNFRNLTYSYWTHTDMVQKQPLCAVSKCSISFVLITYSGCAAMDNHQCTIPLNIVNVVKVQDSFTWYRSSKGLVGTTTMTMTVFSSRRWFSLKTRDVWPFSKPQHWEMF